ncbi:MAG: glucosamine-6-phosphate deaminase [Vicinamibacterales bacterium]
MPADVTVFDDDRALARTLAERIGARLAAKPALVLGLPTGRSPIRLYRELAALHARGRADFAQATTFNLDEFLGIAASHPGSYHAYMRQHLFSKVNLSPERINVLDGTAADPDAECRRYDEAIAAAGGLDLQILGIGTNGHIGFNEPGTTLAGPTHRTPLKLSTRRSNAALFGGDVDRVPREALSMGMATILHARRIVVIATGKSKARCVDRALQGPITTKLPASFLQLHRDVEWMLDRAAAGQ